MNYEILTTDLEHLRLCDENECAPQLVNLYRLPRCNRIAKIVHFGCLCIVYGCSCTIFLMDRLIWVGDSEVGACDGCTSACHFTV